MTPYQSEELENILRQARKGKGYAEARCDEQRFGHSPYIDWFISIMDQVERIKNNDKET